MDNIEDIKALILDEHVNAFLNRVRPHSQREEPTNDDSEEDEIETDLDMFRLLDSDESEDFDSEASEDETPEPFLLTVIDLAFNYLEEALLILGASDGQRSTAKACFLGWIENNKHPFEVIENAHHRPCYDFGIVRARRDDWSYIADIGLRLRYCACSEASCERMISAQRLLLSAQTLRRKDETISARLILMKGFEH